MRKKDARKAEFEKFVKNGGLKEKERTERLDRIKEDKKRMRETLLYEFIYVVSAIVLIGAAYFCITIIPKIFMF